MALKLFVPGDIVTASRSKRKLVVGPISKVTDCGRSFWVKGRNYHRPDLHLLMCKEDYDHLVCTTPGGLPVSRLAKFSTK